VHLEARSASALERISILETEVSSLERERDALCQQASQTAQAWRMRGEQAEAAALRSAARASELEANLAVKLREMAKMQGELAEAKALSAAAQVR
jgi:hypothetical protein